MSLKKFNYTEQGFSLVEAIAALTILAVVLGFAGPLFINQRINNVNSEIRTGAVAASQQILDRLRQTDPTTMPSSGHQTESVSTMGHAYDAAVYYCENASFCGTTSRHIRVEVRNNGKTVHTAETVYTQFR